MSIREQLDTAARERILILDGAMGSMIQKYNLTENDFRGDVFASHHVPLKGCNDVLCLTKPEIIGALHDAYLKAGADIIETCSFNSTSVSLGDFGLSDFAYEISAAAAAIARKCADRFSASGRRRFVAGSMGPTAKSASLSPDYNNPAKRSIYWDELEAAYYDNARGLLDGGADIFMVETIFDTLNAKAALFAISRLLEERGADVPVMISATVSGESGRLLSGQTLEAFCISVLHAKPWAIGLNCSFGAEKLLPHVRLLSDIVPCLTSAHPNAGLPNQLGVYDETPQTMSAHVEAYLKEGLVNIIGGCCGSTPEHIAAIAAVAAAYKGRQAHKEKLKHSGKSTLAGLEPLVIEKQMSANTEKIVLIGERTSVAGSRKFLRLISEGNYEGAAAIARDMVEEGAAVIDISTDDAMLDAGNAMAAFLDFALMDPNISKVPFMINSSSWNVLETGLKRLQGKGLVNSINLKDGEKEFLRRAGIIRRYGAAAVVMLIDEQGQAASYERRIEIAQRSYKLLIDSGFPSCDIVFDPNVFTVATGVSEHNSYATDFIRACSWIRDNCPDVQISGGISNLSFSFRGNNALREAMHSVFLKHAAAAGLSMAIVNPAARVSYGDIEENLRNAIEDVILNRDTEATERLLAATEQFSAGVSPNAKDVPPEKSGRLLDAESRVVQAMHKGHDDIEADIVELLKKYKRPLDIIEGPLMEGMKEVSIRLGKGSMYLPQVIRSARVMKKAIIVLEPQIEAEKRLAKQAASPKILLATVKGDVHDIGKNIVGLVLGCNGYAIIDLGVMVPCEQIIETAEREGVSAVGLSGLISPSLDEMINIAGEMESRGMTIPLLIGGAAASLAHTALRIVPEYSGPVVYVPDAGKSAETVRALLSETERSRFLEAIEESYRKAAEHHKMIQSNIKIIPLAEARANRAPPGPSVDEPKTTGIIELNNYPLDRVIPYIDWTSFLESWEMQGAAAATKENLLEDAKIFLQRIRTETLLTLNGVAGIFPAAAHNEDITLFDPADRKSEVGRFFFPRSLQKKPAGVFNPCLADFITEQDWLGLFALSAGFGMEENARKFRARGDEYAAALLASLANSLTEAFAEEVHLRIRREWWGYAAAETLSAENVLKGEYTGIRPAFGYPSCPNHEDKRIAFKALEAQKRCGFELTESAMMIPAASVCGMFFANPGAYYFSAG
ncbi:MAG: methionine synthase [Treponema sp.]|nr:methionine synthase [Treponema sp.]